MAGVSTVGMVILLLMTSVAVPVFFRRNPSARRDRIVTTYALPVVAVVGLLGSLVLVLVNFTLVTGQSVAISTGLALISLLALAIGFCLRHSYCWPGSLTPPLRRNSGRSAERHPVHDPTLGGSLGSRSGRHARGDVRREVPRSSHKSARGGLGGDLHRSRWKSAARRFLERGPRRPEQQTGTSPSLWWPRWQECSSNVSSHASTRW